MLWSPSKQKPVPQTAQKSESKLTCFYTKATCRPIFSVYEKLRSVRCGTDIPEFLWLSEEDWDNPVLHGKFTVTLGYIERPCLDIKKKKWKGLLCSTWTLESTVLLQYSVLLVFYEESKGILVGINCHHLMMHRHISEQWFHQTVSSYR